MDNFIERSSLKITLAELYYHSDCCVDEKVSVRDLVERFKRSPSLPGLIIMVNKKILGIITRIRCFECLGRPYGVELFMKISAVVFFQYAGKAPLAIPADTRVEDALQLALGRDPQLIFDPIIVQDMDHYGIMTMHTMLTAQISLMKKLFEEVQLLSIKDPLTNVNNRRGFFSLAQDGVAHALSLGQDLGVLMIDIDHFKLVNDHFGHDIGDIVIRAVAEECQNLIRKSDLLGRYGGEEFIILLPDTSLDTAWTIAERIRMEIDKKIIRVDQHEIHVTVCIGISSVHTAHESLEDLLKRADQALYHAKRSGRNQTVIWDPTFEESQSSEFIEPNNPMHPNPFQSTSISRIDSRRIFNETIETWVRALELRDKETEGHSHRVTYLTLEMAKRLGISNASELEYIRWGSLLHDIGKIAIPDSILLKPDKLTEEEWVIMRKHPEYAYELLSPIEYLRPCLDIPYCHHEHWDGGGYPRGLKRKEIPLVARIFTIIDVYDALSSNRRYRPPWPVEKMRAYILDESGKLFDPQIVACFLTLFDEGLFYPERIPVESGSIFDPDRRQVLVTLTSPIEKGSSIRRD